MLISNRCISGLMPNLIKKSWMVSRMQVSTTASYFQLVQLSVPIPWTGQGWSTISHSNSKGLDLVFFRWVCSCNFASSFRNKYKKHCEIAWGFFSLLIIISADDNLSLQKTFYHPPSLGLPPTFLYGKTGLIYESCSVLWVLIWWALSAKQPRL